MISTDTSANVIHDGVGSHECAGDGGDRARDVALGCLVIYLTTSAIVLLAGRHFWLAVGHLAGVEGTRRLWKATTRWAITAGDFLPLAAFPVLYSEIPKIIASLGTPYHDALVQRWEVAIFGTQPATTLAGALPYLPVSEVLHAGYLAYYLVIFIPPVLLFVRGEREGFLQTVAALAITYALCWTLFALFPVQGPRYLFSSPPRIPNGPVRQVVLWVLASGSARGAAFPSSHMAVSLVQTLMAWHWQRPVAWILTPITLLIGVGAVYGGFHYAVDMIAGAGLATIVASISFYAFQRERRRV